MNELSSDMSIVRVCNEGEALIELPSNTCRGSGIEIAPRQSRFDSLVDGWLRGVLQLLKHHRCPRTIRESVRVQLRNYLEPFGARGFTKGAKFLQVWYMAWFLRNPLPPAPLWCGERRVWSHTSRWRGWARSRRFFNNRNVHLWYSWLQTKRSCLPVGPEDVFETLVAHRKSMENQDPLGPVEDAVRHAGEVPASERRLLVEESRRLALPSVRAIAKRVSRDRAFHSWLRSITTVARRVDCRDSVQAPSGILSLPLAGIGAAPGEKDLLTSTGWVPSQGASIESGRAFGGQKNHLLSGTKYRVESTPDLDKYLSWVSPEFIPREGDLDSDSEGEDGVPGNTATIPSLELVDFVRNTAFLGGGSPDLLRVRWWPIARIGKRVERNVTLCDYDNLHVREVVSFNLGSYLEQERARIARQELSSPLKAKTHGILEPLKVRVITKGEALPYYLSKPLQKAVHGAMRRMPQFRLIGRPLCPTDLMDLRPIRRGRYVSPAPGPDGSFLPPLVLPPVEWFSVDYSAATDELSATLSATLMDLILDSIQEKLAKELPDWCRISQVWDVLRETWSRVLRPHEVSYPYTAVSDSGIPEDQWPAIVSAELTIKQIQSVLTARSVWKDQPIEWKKCRGGDLWQVRPATVLQTNGQLMGSPLSFPILCLANYVLFRMVALRAELGVDYFKNRYMAECAGGSFLGTDPTREEDPDFSIQRSLDSQDVRHRRDVLVNGDDMLYVAEPGLWDLHVHLGRCVGLNMTVGKAYHHPSFANANSTCFKAPLDQGYRLLRDDHSNPDQPLLAPWQINYLNTGLLFNQKKVMGDTDEPLGSEERLTHLSASLGKFLAGSLPGRACKLLKQYIPLNKDIIAKELKWRNLFVPIPLGGVGVDPPIGWKYQVSRKQNFIAARSVLRSYPNLVPDRGLSRCIAAEESGQCQLLPSLVALDSDIGLAGVVRGSDLSGPLRMKRSYLKQDWQFVAHPGHTGKILRSLVGVTQGDLGSSSGSPRM